ncbi:MAG TPA: methyltransferase domain-containing protein [Candidatus Polarisedimenticolia bacterium]|nr:methyltransferase domain-containing protein [Candidatus Polarisedimenticolia bacterium]
MNGERVRKMVREVYGNAILQKTGCCGPAPSAGAKADAAAASACCSSTSALPAQGARTSFGCGDPLALASLAPGQVVVDIGSGPGADALAAGELVGPSGRVIGVDMTGPMLARAREAALEKGAANVEFRHGDAESLPVEDGLADWVISNCVVNLVPDKEKVFSEIHRVLKPGGRFSITDLVGENLPAWVLEDPAKYCACIGGAPSEEAFLDAARKAGFRDVQVSDRFEWLEPDLAGTGAKVWSIKVTGVRPSRIAA